MPALIGAGTALYRYAPRDGQHGIDVEMGFEFARQFIECGIDGGGMIAAIAGGAHPRQQRAAQDLEEFAYHAFEGRFRQGGAAEVTSPRGGASIALRQLSCASVIEFKPEGRTAAEIAALHMWTITQVADKNYDTAAAFVAALREIDVTLHDAPFWLQPLAENPQADQGGVRMGKDLRHHAQDLTSRAAARWMVLHAYCRRLQPRQAAETAGRDLGLRLIAP